ncbi:MAG: M12 family metallo-peptidase, partial [Spirosomaceae bacterium]|nr:M12 family metallo-peptidase [Spirosomataceae bacterium]
MKKIYLFGKYCTIAVLFGLLLQGNVFAQREVSKWVNDSKKNQNYSEEKVFVSSEIDSQNSNAIEKGLNLSVDKKITKRLADNPRPTLTLPLPMGNGAFIYLELAQVSITTPSFKVSTKGNNPTDKLSYKEGVHYRGIVRGDDNSLVSLSIINDELSGFISYAGSKIMLGKLKDNSDKHVAYNEKDLKAPTAFACGSQSKPITIKGLRESVSAATTGVGCKVVTVYFECDYKMYQDFGSNTTNVVNYVNSFFSQVATLYANENIDIKISEIKVWTSPDPYASLTSTSSILTAFDTNIGSNFNGNLAHFLTTRSLGGGIAYVDVLCTKPFAHGVSAISTTYAAVPTYSWTVEVVAHELGHNIGSNHTQWCGWTRPDGSVGPLDNCYTPEGTCSTGPAPINGGTIMSYCHLTSTGINFSNGFGTVPGNLIRNKVQNAMCLAPTGTAPTGLSSSNVASTSATVSWLAASGAVNYVVEYQRSGTTTWTATSALTNTSTNLTGLLAGTTYNWRVKTDCSAPSVSSSFTTVS